MVAVQCVIRSVGPMVMTPLLLCYKVRDMIGPMSVSQASCESLADVWQTGKANTYTEYISMPERMSHWTFQDRPSVATVPPSGQLDSSWNMYMGSDLALWQTEH